MTRRRRVWARAAITVVAGLAVIASAGVVSASGRADSRARTPAQQIRRIIAKAPYRGAEWGYLVTDPRTGRTLRRRGSARRLYVPGSSSKLWALSATWKTLGPDSRIATPVYAIGRRTGSTLTGSLALVGQGDLTLGGRTKPDGTIDFRNIDHTYANAVPGAQLTPEDPLAGLDELARELRARGITRVDGDVVVDERLFGLDPTFEAPPLPVMLNDNLIDIVARPGATPGPPATVSYRPAVAPYTLAGSVQTGARGSDIGFTAHLGADGHTITVQGSVPAGGQPVVRVVVPSDRAEFARTAFIEALARAGVQVSAPAVGPNPDPSPLAASPAAYPAAARAAALVSPTYAEDAKLILKTSHNPGASLTICLLAVKLGRSDCEDGWTTVQRFLRRIHIPLDEVVLGAPDGGSEANRESPRAIVDLLTWWLRQPDFARWRHAFAIPGVDGTDAGDLLHSPARGRIHAKDGLRLAGDALNQRPVMTGAAYAGYLDLGHARSAVFATFINGAIAKDIPTALRLFQDVIDVSGLLWREIAHR